MEPQTTHVPPAPAPTPAKPAMDVTLPHAAPAIALAAQPIAVRQAPVEEPDEQETSDGQAAPSTAAKPTEPSPQPEVSTAKKQPKPTSQPALPLGIIVATVVAMVVLSILAVVIYVTSQT